MDLNLFPTATADFTLLGALNSDQTASEPQLWDPSAEYTELITSPGALGLMQGLAFRPAPSVPISTWPTPTGQPRAPRPESQEDWDAKKDTIQKLYLEENLPLQDVIDTMSKKHSFSATERMYKRQFQKWNWRKYNTKAHQQSRAQCIHVESSRGMATCRRPARRRRPNQVPVQNGTVHHLTGRSNPNITQNIATFTIPLLHGNQRDEWTEKTYANLREIIVGTARRDPAWSQSNRFISKASAGFSAYCQFRLAFELFDLEDCTNYGSILREAFREVENTVHGAYDPIEMFDYLLVTIPRMILNEERIEVLQAYLRFLSRMLEIKRPGQPIITAATALQKLFSAEAEPISRHTLDTMLRIISDCYTEVRGEYDLDSIYARLMVLLAIEDSDSTLYINGVQTLHHSLTGWIDDVVEQFGEASCESHAVRVASLMVAQESSLLIDNSFDLCEKGCSLLTEANCAPQKDWDLDSLHFLSIYQAMLADTIEVDDEDLAIFYRRESLSVTECMCKKVHKDTEFYTRFKAKVDSDRIRLIGKLASLGRVQEAAEMRASLARSEYLLEVQEKDAIQLTELFADGLLQECY